MVGKRDAQGEPLVSVARRTAAVAPDRDRRALARAPLPAARPRRHLRARLHAAASCSSNAGDAVKRTALFLRRLSAQHLDQGAGRLARAGRHRLPLHGELDGPRHRGPDPDGRRGRRLGPPLDVHQGAARLPEPRRRHLLPLGLPGDPPGDRRQGQHHLQDPVQRRGGDDRRPAGRRPDQRSTASPARSRPRASTQVVVVSDDIAKYDEHPGSLPARHRVPRRATSSTRCSGELREIRASRC